MLNNKTIARAKELVQRAEQAGGSKQALWIKAIFLRDGRWNGQKDEAAGYALIEQLANDGFFRAKRAVAMRQLEGAERKTAQQRNAALDLLLAAASIQENGDAGDVPAMYVLGETYRKGQSGIDKDWKKAETWYLAAVDGGMPAAYNALGIMHTEGGSGLNANIPKAVEFYMKGVNAGVVDSMVNMGRLYNFPWLSGWERDYKSASNWYRRATAEADARNNQEAKKWAQDLLENIPWLYR